MIRTEEDKSEASAFEFVDHAATVRLKRAGREDHVVVEMMAVHGLGEEYEGSGDEQAFGELGRRAWLGSLARHRAS